MPAPARAAPPLLALLALAGAAAAGTEPLPFSAAHYAVPGRPLEVSAVRVRGERAPRLLVVSVEGPAPDERRHVTALAAGPGGSLRPAGALVVPAEVVAFDVADAVPGGGLEIALLTAERLELRDLASGELLRTRSFEPPLPLPPRTRGLDRRPLLAAWTGDGSVSALVPALGGFVHAPLDGGALQRLRVPLVTDYLVGDDAAGLRPGTLEARIGWPEIAQGDDDGDGRADLLALSRYEVTVFRTGPAGLPERVSRHASLRPFSPEEELRFQATSASLFARDLDGDGLVDLVLHRTFGTLLRSDATTSFWRNRGSGADPTAAPDARIEGSGGFGSVFLEDLDGDGRSEALQLLVPFGAIQLVRALLTETVHAELRAYRLEGPDLTAKRSFETTLTLALATEEGRVAGVLPNVRGDWNGDGLRDLLHGESLERIAIRLGTRGEQGPAFSATSVRQDVRSADRTFVADLDGDGLDDLALYDTQRDGSGVEVLRNRGVLGGAPGGARPAPEIRAPEPPEGR